MIKRILALTAAALVLVVSLYSTFENDIIQAIMSGQPIGPYERAAIRAARSNEERSVALLSETDGEIIFPLPNGAVAFHHPSYWAHVSERAEKFLVRREAWDRYLHDSLPSHGYTAENLNAYYVFTHADSGFMAGVSAIVFARHWVWLVIMPDVTGLPNV